MSKKTAFNLPEQLQLAWDWCWNYYCEPSEYEGRTIAPRQSWLTATDLERRIRAAAVEIMDGREYGSAGPDGGGSRVRITTGTRGSLLDVCRDWLRQQAYTGKLEAHNFGKGHISGMRFRPAGQGLTEAEVKTVAKKEARRNGTAPVHFADPKVQSFPRKTLCSRQARETVKKKSPGYVRSRGRSLTRTTREASEVTCPRCLKAMAAAQASS